MPHLDTPIIYALLSVAVLIVVCVATDRFLTHHRAWQRRIRSRRSWRFKRR